MSREPACVGVTGAAALNVPSDLARRHRQPGVCRRAFWPAVGGQVHGAVAVSRRAGNVRRLVRSRGVRTEKRQTSDRHPNGVRPSVHASFIERPVRQPPSSFLIAQRRGWCHPPNPVFWTLAPASGARHFPGHSVCYWLTLSSRHNRHRTPPERARQSRFAAGIRIISERLSSAMSAEQEDRRGLSANPKRPRRAV